MAASTNDAARGPEQPGSRPPGPEERGGATATRSTGSETPPPPSMGDWLRKPNFWIVVAVLLFLNWFLLPLLFPPPNDRLTISYSLFKQEVTAGNVAEMTSRGDEVQGLFKQPVTDPSPPEGQAAHQYTKFATHIPTFADNQTLDQLLESKGVTITAKPLEEARSPLVTLLLSFGPTLLLIGGFLWLSSRMAGAAGGGGVMGLGRSRARRYDAGDGRPAVTFADVAGIDEVKADLVEIVDFLRTPAKYTRLGGAMPKGVLLLGPPGTGKTLLARAVAGEAGVPFFSISGSEFIEMIVGVGASRVRDLFAQAKAAAPAIIFVDELDAIGRRRGAGNVMGGHDEREQTLNQLLVEMDGFDARQAVIVLAATNRADVLDPALLRPGRFDRRVTVHPPDRAGRAAILRVHTRGVPLAREVDLDAVAGETPGLVGADLRNLVNEAALLAARHGRDAVRQADFSEALEKIALGAERRIALLRPGRFDRRVTVHPPDRAGRAAILRVHTRGVPLAREVDLDAVAGETPGLVGADLRNLVNEAALLAARHGRDAVRQADFSEALEKIALGAERRIALSPAERERVAYHEAGHALVGLLQPEGDPVRRVTVVPRGQALGVTLSVPEADRYNHSEGYLRARIATALGGRAAERVIYGNVTTGAENDLKQVTELARAMVTRWGMSPEIGPLALEGVDAGNFLDAGGSAMGPLRAFGQRIADVADAAVGRIVEECDQTASDLLTRERARLVALAEALLRTESLDEEQIRAVTGLAGQAPPPSPVAAVR